MTLATPPTTRSSTRKALLLVGLRRRRGRAGTEEGGEDDLDVAGPPGARGMDVRLLLDEPLTGLDVGGLSGSDTVDKLGRSLGRTRIDGRVSFEHHVGERSLLHP